MQPTFASVACPNDVTVQILSPVSCGQVTVPEDRSHPEGRRIQLFVVKVEPPGGATAADPVLVVGTSLATQTVYGDMVPVAQYTHRVTYIVDLRGIGHSQPNLDCPEVHAVAPALLGLRMQDPAYATTFLKAVQACHDRLTGQGVAVEAYDSAETSADLEDLRVALGIPSWNLIAYGGAVGLAMDVAGRYPGTVRALVFDSPLFPGSDPFIGAAAAAHAVIDRVAAACTADTACHAKWPDLGASIDQAIAKLDAVPVAVTAASTAGASVQIVFDGATLVRALRETIGAQGGVGIASIPATIAHVLAGTLTGDDPAAVLMASDPGACLGFLPRCQQVNLGVAYTMTCRDFAPSLDTTGLAQIQGVGYAEAFGHDPFLAACAAWAVQPQPVRTKGDGTTAPTLVVAGTLDPYTGSHDALRAALAVFQHAYFVDVPNYSYNAFGAAQCLQQLRGAWIATPNGPPANTQSCLDGIRKPRLVP